MKKYKHNELKHEAERSCFKDVKPNGKLMITEKEICNKYKKVKQDLIDKQTIARTNASHFLKQIQTISTGLIPKINSDYNVKIRKCESEIDNLKKNEIEPLRKKIIKVENDAAIDDEDLNTTLDVRMVNSYQDFQLEEENKSKVETKTPMLIEWFKKNAFNFLKVFLVISESLLFYNIMNVTHDIQTIITRSILFIVFTFIATFSLANKINKFVTWIIIVGVFSVLSATIVEWYNQTLEIETILIKDFIITNAFLIFSAYLVLILAFFLRKKKPVTTKEVEVVEDKPLTPRKAHYDNLLRDFKGLYFRLSKLESHQDKLRNEKHNKLLKTVKDRESLEDKVDNCNDEIDKYDENLREEANDFLEEIEGDYRASYENQYTGTTPLNWAAVSYKSL